MNHSRAPAGSPREPVRGIGLAEALIALALLTLALVGAMRWQAFAHAAAGLARERTDAVELARQHLERLRVSAALEPEPGVEAFSDISATEQTVSGQTARFTLRRDITAGATARNKQAMVTVSWDDRTGTRREVTVRSMIDGALPAHSAALIYPSWPSPVAQPLDRHPDIPQTAYHLGNGQSAWTPAAHGTTAGRAPTFVIDNTSGKVVSMCATASFGEPPIDCQAYQGAWLSGHVRFALNDTPYPAQANDTPLPFDMRLELDAPVGSATCESAAHRDPARAERFAHYTCVVPLHTGDGGWSGRLSIVPRGWSVGPNRTDKRICRFSADLDASGAVDRNEEHPDRYAFVTGPLTQQNFLVVRGDQRCPHSGPPPHNDASVDTVPHLP